MRSKLLFLAKSFSGLFLIDSIINIQPEEPLTKCATKTINETALSWMGYFKAVREGYGCYRTFKGGFYEGQVKRFQPNGQGTLKYAEGNVYSGEWRDGRAYGQGTLEDAEGNVYSGEWKDSRKHGQGTLKYANGAFYTGEWKDGLWHGQGLQKYTDGSVYSGEWKDGLRHGQGTLKWPEGDVYRGEWKDGREHGQGTQKYANGDVYSGEWFKGWPSTHLKDKNIIPLEELATFNKTSSFFGSKTTKKGIIFQATADHNGAFEPHKENCHELSQTLAAGGFDTNYSLFSSRKDLENQIRDLPEKISLVWLRAHGYGNSFDCGNQYGDIQTLSLLEDKISKDPIIVLQSCNTGEPRQLGEQLRDYLCKRNFKPTIIAPDGATMFKGIDVKKLRLGDVDVKMVDSKGADITRFLTCPERQTPPSIS